MGACAHDIALVDFDRVFQDMKGAHDSGQRCDGIYPHRNLGGNEGEIAVALSAGWADIYVKDLPDNYVGFDHENPEGDYVMQGVVDVAGLIVETDEADNLGYTHFRVSNCTATRCDVEVLERGRGAHPWDDGRIVLSGLGQ